MSKRNNQVKQLQIRDIYPIVDKNTNEFSMALVSNSEVLYILECQSELLLQIGIAACQHYGLKVFTACDDCGGMAEIQPVIKNGEPLPT